MNELVEVIEGATELWEKIKCEECGTVIRFIRFHPFIVMKKCEYYDWYGQAHINEYINCPKCFCSILRYPTR